MGKFINEFFRKTRFSGIFGYQMITPSDNRVVLTTNERDALAVYDSTNGIPALTLPNGERLDQSVMPYLEDFELIYLWLVMNSLDLEWQNVFFSKNLKFLQ